MQLFFMIKGGKGDIMGKDMTSDKDKGRFKRKYSLGVQEVWSILTEWLAYKNGLDFLDKQYPTFIICIYIFYALFSLHLISLLIILDENESKLYKSNFEQCTCT